MAQTENKTGGSVIVAQKGSRRGIESQPGRKIHIHAQDHPLTKMISPKMKTGSSSSRGDPGRSKDLFTGPTPPPLLDTAPQIAGQSASRGVFITTSEGIHTPFHPSAPAYHCKLGAVHANEGKKNDTQWRKAKTFATSVTSQLHHYSPTLQSNCTSKNSEESHDFTWWSETRVKGYIIMVPR